ncbi:MAG: helix-turn-helix domain-containing protein [Clostridia bacterium]|nr:helix-turn-helix domain-containing protein [Clostridia bacterium]
MTLDDRIEIQKCLCKGMHFKDIAKRIGKDRTTLKTSREGILLNKEESLD